MGFRTTIISEDFSGTKLPEWFIDKWRDGYTFGESEGFFPHKDTMLIASKYENKMYNGKYQEILVDIQKVCRENDIKKFILVMLHECGGITRVQIEKDTIRFSEPTKWKEVEEVQHVYCYECSDMNQITENT